MSTMYQQEPVQTETGQWRIKYDGTGLLFPSEAAARVGMLLHQQAAAVEKKHDGVSPAASVGGGPHEH